MNLGNLLFSRLPFTRIAGMGIATAMNLGSIYFGRRIRQNHALEHAAIAILNEMAPDLEIFPRSSAAGLIIFEDVDLELLRRLMDEALRRLQAGEAELAIHPNCGTNIFVSVFLIALGTLFGLTSNQPRTRFGIGIASSVAGLIAARPLGEYAQHHLSTLSDLTGVRITEIARREFFGLTFIEVRTVQE